MGGETHRVPEPFLVIATQNPIDMEGTYPLPEAQLDRFMFNIKLEYLSNDEELSMVKSTTSNRKVGLQKIISGSDIEFFQQLIRKIPVADNVMNYAVSLARKTRPEQSEAPQIINDYVSWGAVRAPHSFSAGSKCHAAINGKYSPDIEDVKESHLFSASHHSQLQSRSRKH